MDANSIAWLKANYKQNPVDEIGEFKPVCGDARQVTLAHGWQWVDIDPFGSPIPFLDSAMQSLARRAVLEVTATDVAALTGSSPAPLMRRYAARARLDEIAHDTGMRILLATIARCAARHNKVIEPLISTWDSHHLRVSVRVRKSLDSASIVEQNLGWRIADPTVEEAGNEFGCGHILVPLDTVVDRADKRISGPLWSGPIGDAEVMASMTEERALELCGPTEEMVEDETELRLRRRAITRCVRHLAAEATAISGNLLVVDSLASRLKLPAPPSPTKLAEALVQMGHDAAVAAYGKPAIRTTAPWQEILNALESV
jgi:tRNA (guanine26-N2/guanine27-N2)-dimethyltransferase